MLESKLDESEIVSKVVQVYVICINVVVHGEMKWE